jgi:hypothetical protein
VSVEKIDPERPAIRSTATNDHKGGQPVEDMGAPEGEALAGLKVAFIDIWQPGSGAS